MAKAMKCSQKFGLGTPEKLYQTSRKHGSNGAHPGSWAHFHAEKFTEEMVAQL